MTKLYFYLKQGVNIYKFRERALWRFENIPQDEQVTLTDQNGSVTQLFFGQGYWSFLDLQKEFAESNVTLTPILHNSTCRISSLEYTVDLGNIGLTKDSGRININQGLESLVISSSLVDDQSVFNSSGEHSQVIAILPIDTTQRLNATMTNYGELEFSAPIFNRNVRQFTITVGDNLHRTAVKLHLFAECQIKNGK